MIEKTETESAVVPTESPEDQEDAPIPCKGCGEILEEGKAFELAGNRWHIDCFRCHTCGTFLDSDANLLLLGDGSLICNNCTYSCSSCGNKIEDLAILTGDQAFCATCFKCRNCKRKIENLRYARTSQGIFCMDCHESLMARRRKRTARNAAQRQKTPSSGVHLDKSLPSLPPTPPDGSTIPPQSGTPSEMYSDTTTERASRLKSEDDGSQPRQDSLSKPYASNEGENIILPSSTYNSKRHSVASHRSDASGGEEFLIPVAFDPTPSEHHSPHVGSSTTSKTGEDRPRDYNSRITPAETQPIAPEPTTEKPNKRNTYEEKQVCDPEPSERRRGDSHVATGSHGKERSHQGVDDREESDSFKLQDAPRRKKTMSSSSSTYTESDISHEPLDTTRPATSSSTKNTLVEDSSSSQLASSRSRERRPTDTAVAGATSPLHMQQIPKRGDSLESKLHRGLQRKDVPGSTKEPQDYVDSKLNTVMASPSSSSETTKTGPTMPENPSSKRSFDASTPIATPQTGNTSATASSKDQVTSPRGTPQLSADNRHNRSRNGSSTTLRSDSQAEGGPSSPSLPRYSAGGDFSLDEDMARILGPDEIQNQESFLRRVSQSVRHGRSFSDKGSRLSREQKWSSPTTGSATAQDINSPTANHSDRDELAWFKNELKRERQKVAEKDQRISELANSLNATVNIKQVNTELREKRSTMVFLDAQKEVVLRELEIFKEHIASEKQTSGPLDLGKMSNGVLRDLAESIQRLKDSFVPQIEDLIQKRNELVEELGNLGRLKDKSFKEFEQLSLKNAQLAELNNQLVHQIQELYKASSNSAQDSGRSAPNGLGIYSHHKDKSSVSVDTRDAGPPANESAHQSSGTNIPGEEAEPVTVIQGPQVVNIRKGPPKKFNWKKGQNVAKGVTKGIKGAFLYQRDGQFTETAPYGNVSQDGSGGIPRSQTHDPSRQGFGFFGNQKHKPAPSKSNLNGSSITSPDGSTLYGSELEQRIEIEKGVIPGIVTRCIEEVELRGMDVEGIYRKSGGSSQVQYVREGFERSREFDISDPDLDIHSVTSALKTYFRMLPSPLITYNVYDILLEGNTVYPSSARVESIQLALKDLPRVHRDVLEFLVFHLKRVVDREKENLMTSTNVAVVFAPTIMRPESLSREMTDVQKKTETLRFLVENCQDIFMGIQE